MQLSTRARYAVMAMVDLATRQAIGCECGPICLAEIAARQQLSLAYLEQLFAKLRRGELVASARGPGGGYRLARPSDTITIGAIVGAVEEPIQATRCHPGTGGCLAAPRADSIGERCQTHDLWAELSKQIGLFLDGVTLADVVTGRVVGRAVSLTEAATKAEPVGTTAPLAAE
jgi:Rrf2 family transcriptional regulator, iron-sulfur cluster assembly transcription factor